MFMSDAISRRATWSMTRGSGRPPSLAAVGSILLLLGCASCGGSSSQGVTSSMTASPAISAAQKLAENQTGKSLSTTAPLVRQIAQHLTSLHTRCRGSTTQVAGYIDFASTDLAKHGIRQSRSALAALFDHKTRHLGPQFDCQGFVAAYLVVEESSSATASATTTTAGTTPSATSHGCGDITVNAVTSCPFANDVEQAYDANPSSAVQASSPVTGKSYTMTCSQSSGTVTCTGGTGAQLAFPGPSPAGETGTATGTETSTSPGGTTTGAVPSTSPVEGPGSSSHATDAQFCSSHSCIDNFSAGNGTIVQCTDGQWSHSGGLSRACSDHGGEKP